MRHCLTIFALLVALLPGCGREPAGMDRAEQSPTALPHAVQTPAQQVAAITGEKAPQVAEAPAPAGQTPVAVEGEAVYRKSCAACHGPGIAGAPRLGDGAAWAPRLAKGMETLYRHAIEGFTGASGVMPPRGGNPTLSDDEVRGAVRYMVEKSR